MKLATSGTGSGLGSLTKQVDSLSQWWCTQWHRGTGSHQLSKLQDHRNLQNNIWLTTQKRPLDSFRHFGILLMAQSSSSRSTHAHPYTRNHDCTTPKHTHAHSLTRSQNNWSHCAWIVVRVWICVCVDRSRRPGHVTSCRWSPTNSLPLTVAPSISTSPAKTPPYIPEAKGGCIVIGVDLLKLAFVQRKKGGREEEATNNS